MKRRVRAGAAGKFVTTLNGATGVTQASASRMAWPSVERNLPDMEKRIDGIIRDYYRIANRKFS
jgi:hypothetical protein